MCLITAKDKTRFGTTELTTVLIEEAQKAEVKKRLEAIGEKILDKGTHSQLSSYGARNIGEYLPPPNYHCSYFFREMDHGKVIKFADKHFPKDAKIPVFDLASSDGSELYTFMLTLLFL